MRSLSLAEFVSAGIILCRSKATREAVCQRKFAQSLGKVRPRRSSMGNFSVDFWEGFLALFGKPFIRFDNQCSHFGRSRACGRRPRYSARPPSGWRGSKKISACEAPHTGRAGDLRGYDRL